MTAANPNGPDANGAAPDEEIHLHRVRSNRFVPAPIEQAINTVLSRGPGYEPVPIGTRFEVDRVAGYYIDHTAKTESPALADPSRVNAIPVIQLGLGWYERHLAGDAAARGRFLEICELIERRGQAEGDELRWPMTAPTPKFELSPPWCSALSQGQAGSLFVRAHLETGEDRYADLALRAVRPLLSPVGSDLVTHTAEGPVLQEYPSNPPSHVLNGWISALWGIWDVHQALGDGEAGQAVEAGIRCLRETLPAYDTGWWSRYSLYPLVMEDLAKPIYQRFHVAQLTVLQRMTGDVIFQAFAERWEGYDTPGHRAMALAQKALFAAADGPRRRRWHPVTRYA